MSDTADLATAARTREQQVSRAFVALADTLAADFDIADFLDMLVERTTELLAVSAAAVILVGTGDKLEVLASSSQRAELLELFAVQTEGGPCIDCIRTGDPVTCTDLKSRPRRWLRFADAAQECGFRAVHAVPMRLREQTIGVLTLLGTDPGALDDDHLRLGQAMADVATIAILQHRAIEQSERVTGELQTALNTRVVIEQAKGILAERGGLSTDEAFTRLRDYARAHNLRLTELASAVTAGTTDLDTILIHRRR
jgi:GAF domain-containing protein